MCRGVPGIFVISLGKSTAAPSHSEWIRVVSCLTLTEYVQKYAVDILQDMTADSELLLFVSSNVGKQPLSL